MNQNTNWVDDDFESAYANANPEEGNNDFEPLPVGHYQCAIEHIMPKLTRSGKKILDWQFKILTGPYANRKIWMSSNLSAERALFIKRDFAKIGFEGDSVKALINNQSKLDSAIGYVVVVSITEDKNGKLDDRTGKLKTYTNLYKFVSTGELDPNFKDVEKKATEDDDEVPF